MPQRSSEELPSALERWGDIDQRLAQARPALFLDYDGTLTPIVARPDAAKLGESMRERLRALSAVAPLAVVSGRERANVESLVGLKDLYYVGSHGFDIVGRDGLRWQHPGGLASQDDLDRAETRLREELAPVVGALVERKRFSIAVHYRNVALQDRSRIEKRVEATLASCRSLRKALGKMVVELRPAVDWDKGEAVRWLLVHLGLGPEALPIYLGDDLTDEDAFRILAHSGIGVFVGDARHLTAAHYRLRDTQEVEELLGRIEASIILRRS